MSGRTVAAIVGRLAARCVAAALATGLVACDKEAAPAPSVAAEAPPPANAEAPATAEAASTANGADVRARRERLAAAFHGHRCVLTGAVLPGAGSFGAPELADAATFEAAWAAEAAVAPGWAAEAAMASYRDGCGAKVEAADGQQE